MESTCQLNRWNQKFKSNSSVSTAPSLINFLKISTSDTYLLAPTSMTKLTKDMEYDTKNKHRISDARWRDSVSRCYNLLKQCAYAEQESTRMSILRLILEQIESYETHLGNIGYLEQVKGVFGQCEALSLQQSQQLQEQQQDQQQNSD